MVNFKSLPQLLDFFKDEKTCIKYYEQLRWNGTPACPHCGSLKPYTLKKGYKCSSSECHKTFTVKVGSIFHSSKIPLRIWFAAIYLYVSRKKGVSSVQLSIDLNVTQKTAWFMLHRIRKLMQEQSAQPLKADRIIETDETYIGGREKNRHKKKKLASPQTGLANDGTVYNKKMVVIGAIERSGRVVIRHIPNAQMRHVSKFIKDVIPKQSIVISDEHTSYRCLEKNYFHHRVNHSLGVYVVGNAYTNTMENFWSTLKRGIYGTYHKVSGKHLPKYLNEFSTKFNLRKLPPNENFNILLSNSEGNLLYRDLIA